MPAPAFHNAFVGRQAEAAAVLDAVSRPGALACLTGPGGVGKTRLAVHALRSYRGPVVFVDLSEARTDAEMVDAVVGALGLNVRRAESVEDVAAQVGAWLANRRNLLLVFDNLEQLQPCAPALVRGWRDAAPETRFLATSRQPLGLDGEDAFRLSPLSVDLGAELFRARVPPTVSELDPATVRDVVAQLDALPLAIELAAARLEILPLDALAAGLEDRFGVVRDPGRHARHRSLHQVIAWSWNLLAPWQQRAMVHLSTFRGGAPADAAEHVVVPGEGHHAREALDSLVRASLVREGEPIVGAARYTLLVSIAAFVKAVGATDPTLRDAEARHAGWFLERAPQWSRGYHRDEALRARLDADYANVEAVRMRGVRDGDRDGAVRATAALACQYWVAWRAMSPALLERADAVIDLAERYDLPPGRALYDAYGHRAYVRRWLGRVEEALADMQTASRVAHRLDDPKAALMADGYTGNLLALLGRSEEARARYASALEGARRIGDKATEGVALQALATDDWRAGRPDLAVARMEKALSCLQATGASLETARARSRLSSMYFTAGEPERAVALVRAALDGLDGPVDLANGHVYVGRALHALGDTDGASRAFAESSTHWDIHVRNAGPLVWAALLDIERGALDAAESHLVRAVGAVDEAGPSDRSVAALAHAALALVGACRGQAEATLRHRDHLARLLPVGYASRGLSGMLPVLRALHAAAEAAARRCPDDVRSHGQVAVEAADALPGLAGGTGAILVRLVPVAVRSLERLAHTWAVPRDGTWFDPPGHDRVDLAHRKTLARVLAALAAASDAVPLEDLFEQVWGGERVTPASARNRVFNAISQLRRLGLDIIAFENGAYRLSGPVEVV